MAVSPLSDLACWPVLTHALRRRGTSVVFPDLSTSGLLGQISGRGPTAQAVVAGLKVCERDREFRGRRAYVSVLEAVNSVRHAEVVAGLAPGWMGTLDDLVDAARVAALKVEDLVDPLTVPCVVRVSTGIVAGNGILRRRTLGDPCAAGEAGGRASSELRGTQLLAPKP